ncbi:MAG: hypothetical protein JNM86_10060 [Phycisphaerae bacterium]|nr:hypothetical protein [Phycisphaerae bacterium]
MTTLRGGNGAEESRARSATRSVLLRHTLPDGSVHLDWMIERPDAAAGLISFRVDVGVDLSKAGGFAAERIGDHRRDYLTYEGAVSGGRGEVERIAEFGVLELVESVGGLRVELERGTSGGRMRWTGEQEIGPRWKFVGVVC